MYTGYRRVDGFSLTVPTQMLKIPWKGLAGHWKHINRQRELQTLSRRIPATSHLNGSNDQKAVSDDEDDFLCYRLG